MQFRSSFLTRAGHNRGTISSFLLRLAELLAHRLYGGLLKLFAPGCTAVAAENAPPSGGRSGRARSSSGFWFLFSGIDPPSRASYMERAGCSVCSCSSVLGHNHSEPCCPAAPVWSILS